MRLLASGYWLQATGYRLQATATRQRSDRTEGSGAAATSLQPRDGADGGGHKVRLQATGYWLQATGYRLQPQGSAQIVQKDLVPLLRHYSHETELMEVVIR